MKKLWSTPLKFLGLINKIKKDNGKNHTMVDLETLEFSCLLNEYVATSSKYVVGHTKVYVQMSFFGGTE